MRSLRGRDGVEDVQAHAAARVLENLAVRADRLLQVQGMTTESVLDWFMDIKAHEHVLMRQRLPKGLAHKMQRVSKALPDAIRSGRVECAQLSLDNREILGNGLGVLLRTGRWIFMPEPKDLAELNDAVRKITDGLLCGLGEARAYEAARQIGGVLNLLNWVSRGLKAGVLVPTASIKAAFAAALDVLVEQGRHLTAEQWGKSCMQLNTMQNFRLLDMDHPPERERFRAALRRFLGVEFQELAARASLYELGHAGNLLKDSLEKGLWNMGAAGAAAQRLISCCKTLLAAPVKPGEEVSLVNFSNLLRVLHERGKEFADAGVVFGADFDAVCLAILAWVGDAQPQLGTLQSHANLASFAKAMDKRFGRERHELTTQAIAALVKPIGSAMVAHADTRSIGAILGALAHFWQGGWQTPASRQAGLALARACHPGTGQHWHDESVASALHGLTPLLQTGLPPDQQDAAGAALVRMLRQVATMEGRHLDTQSRLHCLRALHHVLTRDIWTITESQGVLTVLLGHLRANALDANRPYGLADVEAALEALEREPGPALPGQKAVAAVTAGAGEEAARDAGKAPKGPSYRAEQDATVPQSRKPPQEFQAKRVGAWRQVPGKGRSRHRGEGDRRAAMPQPVLVPRKEVQKEAQKEAQEKPDPALDIDVRRNAEPGAQSRATIAQLRDQMFALLQAGQGKKDRRKQAPPPSNPRLLNSFKALARENPGYFPQVLHARDHGGRLLLHHAVVNGLPGLVDWLCSQGGLPAGMETAWLLRVLAELDDDNAAARKSLEIVLGRLKKSRKAMIEEFHRRVQGDEDRFSHLFECRQLLQKYGFEWPPAVARIAYEEESAGSGDLEMMGEFGSLIAKVFRREDGYFQRMLAQKEGQAFVLPHASLLLMEAARCGELETVNDFLNDLHWPQPARADACAKALRQAIIVNEEYMHWLKFSKTPGARINLGRSRGFDELSFHVNDEIHRYPIDIPFLSQSLKALPHAPDGAIVNADCSDLILYRFFRSASIMVRLQKELSEESSGTSDHYRRYSCLHLPIRFGYTDLVEPLLELGVNANGHDGSEEKMPVLVMAKALQQRTTVELLLRYGAAPNASASSPPW